MKSEIRHVSFVICFYYNEPTVIASVTQQTQIVKNEHEIKQQNLLCSFAVPSKLHWEHVIINCIILNVLQCLKNHEIN